MKIVTSVFGAVFLVLLFSVPAAAGDFAWMQELNIQARSDMSGFRASLATRFRIGNAQITAVIGNVKSPADAYLVFRLAEMSNLPPERVLAHYKAGGGWGVIAKNLGIKPGSPEFHALKRNHDLYPSSGQGKAKGKGKKF